MSDARRGVWRARTTDELLPLLGLAGFGYALPLLDLLGTNPEFLVSHYLTGGALVLAAIVVATVPPLVALATVAVTHLVSDRAARLLWAGWVLVFGAMAAGSLLRHLDLPSDALQALLALAGGIAVL
ncbi:MAG: hypothetical protein KDB10_18385, partial [Acidimicrobiales bacterium]|nr:hypothetical protein [Acidimicrobiales bacterium]